MATYSIGEEVIYRDQRYVIGTASPRPPYQFRLLATTPDGMRVVLALESELTKMERYTHARNDTESIRSSAPRSRHH